MKLFLSIVFSLALLLGTGFALQASAQAIPAAGCATPGGYNTSTGMACNTSTVIPLGCSSPAGFSGATGTPCNGYTAQQNGYGGTMINPNGFLDGCSSTAGYSATTGLACNTPLNGFVYTGNGTRVNVGATATTTTATTIPVAPTLPTTGAGDHTLLNLALLLISGTAVAFGVRYGVQQFATNK